MILKRLDDLIEILNSGFVGQVGRSDDGSNTQERAENVLRGKGDVAGNKN
jgi:hypothetical protein